MFVSQKLLVTISLFIQQIRYDPYIETVNSFLPLYSRDDFVEVITNILRDDNYTICTTLQMY